MGAVIHDTNLKPRTVSPPPTEFIMQSLEETVDNTELLESGDDEDQYDQVEDQDENYFHCPYCEDFKTDDQILIGDHVIINHRKEHIARNSQPPEIHECSLCNKKLVSGNQLQDHVRSDHPDVVVI